MEKGKVKNILILAIYILFILLFMVLIVNKDCQNDLFFDLKTGETILKYGVDFKDHFSFIPNLIYLYHHFLYDILIYYTFKFFNYSGVFLTFLLVFSALGITIFLTNYKYSKSRILSLLISLVTLLIMNIFLTNRVQSITYLLFYLEIYFLNNLYNTGKWRYSIYLIIISILIANMHMPLWILAIIFILPFMVEYLFSKTKILKTLFSSRVVIKKVKNEKRWLITVFLLLFTGFLTPFKYYPYTFFITALGNKDYLFIAEMLKTVFIDYKYMLFLFCLMIVLGYVLKLKMKMRDFTFLIGLFLFSTIANRNIAFVYLFYPTIMLKIIIENYDIKKIFNLSFKNPLNNYVCLSLILIILGGGYIYFLKRLDLANFDYQIKEDYPYQSVKYIKENLDYSNIKLFNEFNFGSFLLYNDIPVFIDSRAEVYNKKFNGGKDIINDYLDTDKFNKYKSVFKKYNFDYALIYNGSNLYNYLINDNDFKPIYYENSDYVLFKCNV